jgi:hypothetical protein
MPRRNVDRGVFSYPHYTTYGFNIIILMSTAAEGYIT